MPRSDTVRRSSRVALAATAGASGLALALTGVAPAQATPTPLPASLQIICPDLGTVSLTTHGALAKATAPAGPVRLVGSPRVSAVSSSGRALASTPIASTPGTITCAPVTINSAAASAVLPAAQLRAAKVTASATVRQIKVTYSVAVDTASVLATAQSDDPAAFRAAAFSAMPNDPAGYGPVTAFPSNWGVTSYVKTRANLSMAYRALDSKTIYVATGGSGSNVTASIVKVQIMATVMRQAQQAGRGLTAWEKSQLVPMITQSDNTAASNLWSHVGGGAAVARVIGLMGLRNTVPGPGQYWGLTVTNAPDQVVLVDHFARANPVLNDANRAYGLSLMRRVISGQNWGVTAGPGTDNAVKNGWLPRADGWHVNSIGFLDDAPRAYVLAGISSSGSASMGTLIGRIEGASRLVWSHQTAPSTSTTPTVRTGVRGDWNRDGKADVLGLTNGTLKLFLSTGNGLAAPVSFAGAGWGAMKWIGTPGDVNGDGVTDLLAVKSSNGHLYLYRGTTKPGLQAGVDLGAGWGGYTALATPGDVDGDKRPDLIARAANGTLWQFRLNASGAPTKVRQLAGAWGGFRALLGSGDFNKDGRGDLLAITSSGRIDEYVSTGTGFKLYRTGAATMAVGSLSTSTDVTGDGVADLVVRGSTTALLRKISTGGAVATATNTGRSLVGYSLLA